MKLLVFSEKFCYQIQTRTALWLWLRFKTASWSNISVHDPFSWINITIWRWISRMDHFHDFMRAQHDAEVCAWYVKFDTNPFGVWVKKLQVLFDTHTFSHISYVSPFWNVLGFPNISFEFFFGFRIFSYNMAHIIWAIWLMLYGAYSTIVDYRAWTGPELEHIRGVCLALSKLMISFVWRHLKVW